jgi:hypothetical protein
MKMREMLEQVRMDVAAGSVQQALEVLDTAIEAAKDAEIIELLDDVEAGATGALEALVLLVCEEIIRAGQPTTLVKHAHRMKEVAQ